MLTGHSVGKLAEHCSRGSYGNSDVTLVLPGTGENHTK